MNIDELRAFIAAIELGSVQAAARDLDMPRATVSRRLAQLEERLGTALFHRDHAGTSPTTAAFELVGKARAAVDAADAILRPAPGSSQTRCLRIVLPLHCPASLATAGVQVLKSAFPTLQIDLRFRSHPPSSLPEGADVAVHAGPLGNDTRVQAVVIDRAPVHLVVSKGTLAQRGVPQQIADLERFRVAAYVPGGEEVGPLPLKSGGQHPYDYDLICGRLDVALAVASEPGWIVLGEIPKTLPIPAELTTVLTDVVQGSRPLWLLTPTAVSEVPEVRAAISFMQQTIEGLVSNTPD